MHFNYSQQVMHNVLKVRNFFWFTDWNEHETFLWRNVGLLLSSAVFRYFAASFIPWLWKIGGVFFGRNQLEIQPTALNLSSFRGDRHGQTSL